MAPPEPQKNPQTRPEIDYQTNLRFGRFRIERGSDGVTITRSADWKDWAVLPALGLLAALAIGATFLMASPGRRWFDYSPWIVLVILIPAAAAQVQKLVTRTVVQARPDRLTISLRGLWKVDREDYQRGWMSHICVEKSFDRDSGMGGKAVVGYLNDGRSIRIARGRRRDLEIVADAIRGAMSLPRVPAIASTYPFPTPRRFDRIITASGAVISYKPVGPWIISLLLSAGVAVGWFFFDFHYLNERAFDKWSSGTTFSLLRAALASAVAAVIVFASVSAFRGKWTMTLLPDGMEVRRDGFRPLHEQWELHEIEAIDPPTDRAGPHLRLAVGTPLELIGRLPDAKAKWLHGSLLAGLAHARETAGEEDEFEDDAEAD